MSEAKIFTEIKQNDHPVNIGFNSNNRFISRWLWYVKNLLPKKMGGFKEITYEQLKISNIIAIKYLLIKETS